MSDSAEENDEMSTTAVRNLRPELQSTEETPHEQVSTMIPTGLSATKVITDESSLYDIVAGLISSRLSMSDTKAAKMKTQLTQYLKSNDIIDEDLLSVMTDLTMWPQDNNLPKISVPIRSSLTQIATYTESILAKNLYLSDGVTFNQIRTMHHDFKRQQSEDLKREGGGQQRLAN